jgi:hypothetical protein
VEGFGAKALLELMRAQFCRCQCKIQAAPEWPTAPPPQLPPLGEEPGANFQKILTKYSKDSDVSLNDGDMF